jgi:2-keto-4-pentenoate hydratase/2-oxohepta-3-ene-1,7-dioic acid hydratase in catechol pathway
MKLAVFSTNGAQAVGVVMGEDVLNLTSAWPVFMGRGEGPPPVSLVDLLGRDGFLTRLAGLSDPDTRKHTHRLADVSLHPPLAQCGKLICVASNYAAHIAEAGLQVPSDRHAFTPWLFLKPCTSIIGPGAPIPIPRRGQAIDWEIELGAVIGRPGRYIPAEQALEHVGGYTILNDISERHFTVPAGRQARDWDKFFDWLHGKWFDGFAPMGPWLVTADEIPDPQALTMELRVNGRVRQHGSTQQMIYSVAELVAFASSIMTLLPGDVIATGTPQGVGSATNDCLKPGDVVECAVERIGTMVNPVRAEDDLGKDASGAGAPSGHSL